MLTGMTERDWWIALEVFDAAQSIRGEPGHDDRKFLDVYGGDKPGHWSAGELLSAAE